MNQYYSFLIVNHPTHIDIYHMGFPVGVIRNGKFEPHHIIQGDNKRQVDMKDFPKSPFNDGLTLTEDIINIVKNIYIKSPPENQNKDKDYEKYLELKKKYEN